MVQSRRKIFLSSFSTTAFGYSWLSPFTRDTIHSKPFGFPFSPSVEGWRDLSSQTFHLVLYQNICVRLRDPRCLSVAKLSRLEGSQSFMWTFYADLVKLIPFFFLSLWHQKTDCFCSWNLRGQLSAEESYNHVKICSVLIYLFVPFLLFFLYLFHLKMWLVGFYNYFRTEWGNLECHKLDRLKPEADKIIHAGNQK